MRIWKKTAMCLLGMLIMLATFGGVTLAAEATEDAGMPIEVAPLTDEDLELSLKYGTRIVIPEGTEYYASADGFGSGASGMIGSRYTPLGVDAYVSGFALLDAEGSIVDYRSYIPGMIPIAEIWQGITDEIVWERVWISFFVDADSYNMVEVASTGWLPVRSIAVINGVMGDGGSNEDYRSGVRINPELKENAPPESDNLGAEKTEFELPNVEDTDLEGGLEPEVIDTVLPDPGNMFEYRVIPGQDAPDDASEDTAFISTREIAYAIEDYSENGERVALLLDGSASVKNYMSAIADYGEYVDKVNKADIIIAFGGDFLVIQAEDYLDAKLNRKRTDIFTPLSSLPDISDYDRIIIVTDTYHNTYAQINSEACEGFEGKIIIVSPIDLNEIEQATIREIEEAFATKVYLCLLNNELDRLKALELIKTR